MSLLFTPLDDQPLVESKHILITAMARDAQTDTRYSADGTQLLDAGRPPLMMEPVQATLTFKGPPITRREGRGHLRRAHRAGGRRTSPTPSPSTAATRRTTTK